MKTEVKQASKKWSLKRWWAEERGATGVWFAATLPIFLGVTALALDMSYAMMMRQRLQITASSAALAGAKGLNVSQAEAISLANDYATANMAAYGDVLQDVDISIGTVDMISVPRGDFVAGGGNPNAVRVTTRLANANSNPLQLFFASIAGWSEMEIDTTATAITINQPPPDACLIALNETDQKAGLKLPGEGSIDGDGCGICINSTRPLSGGSDRAALDLNGEVGIDVGGPDGTLGAILVAGDYYENGSVYTNPEPDINQDVAPPDDDPLCADPFKDITEYDLPDNVCDLPGPTVNVNGVEIALNPELQTDVDLANPITGGTAVGDRLPAGIHCNLDSFEGGSPLEFETGVHYIVDTVLKINGKSDEGVFTSTGPGGSTFVMSGSDLEIANSTHVYLTALPDPTTGDPGLIFWQDPDNPNPNPAMNINGGQDFFINGTVYLGQEDVEINGAIASSLDVGDKCLVLLAGTFLLGGTPDLDLATGGCGSIAELPPNAVVVRLVE